MSVVLELSQVSKVYDTGPYPVKVLDEIDLVLNESETASIVGPSGSGKTTLLSLCAGLDHPTSGVVRLLDQDLKQMNEASRASLRNQHLGFIFQSFHLMPSLTALENVLLPMELANNPNHELARDLLENVGLGKRLDHYPAQLSGGEQQRVAIARAFINQPKILFADEPTGNLDRHTNDRVVELIFELNQKHGTTLLLITHDDKLANLTDRKLQLGDGKIVAGQA